MDRVLDYALWLTVRELEPYWMPEFQAGKLTFGGDAKKLAFALERGRQQGHREAGRGADRLRQGAEGERPRAVPVAGRRSAARRSWGRCSRMRSATRRQRNPNGRSSFERLRRRSALRHVGPPSEAAELLFWADQFRISSAVGHAVDGNVESGVVTRCAAERALHIEGSPVLRASALEGLALFGDRWPETSSSATALIRNPRSQVRHRRSGGTRFASRGEEGRGVPRFSQA